MSSNLDFDDGVYSSTTRMIEKNEGLQYDGNKLITCLTRVFCSDCKWYLCLCLLLTVFCLGIYITLLVTKVLPH